MALSFTCNPKTVPVTPDEEQRYRLAQNAGIRPAGKICDGRRARVVEVGRLLGTMAFDDQTNRAEERNLGVQMCRMPGHWLGPVFGAAAPAGVTFDAHRGRFAHKPPAARYFTFRAAQRDIGHHPFETLRTICVDRLRQLLPNAPLCRTSKDIGCFADRKRAQARLLSFVSLLPNVLLSGYKFETEQVASS